MNFFSAKFIYIGGAVAITNSALSILHIENIFLIICKNNYK